jgi:hypothetical protein
MPQTSRPNQSQPQILRTYTALHQLRSAWGGQLILSLGLNPEGAALAIAANIAGAVSLAIDNDPSHISEITRTGACDFIVNTLDEAIRAMKNELRKQAPLSVALTADPVLTLAEIKERGLAPQLFSNFLPLAPHIEDAAADLRALGATLIDFHEATPPPQGFQSSHSLLSPLLKAKSWSLQTFTFETTSALRDFDAQALALLPDGAVSTGPDTLRRRWLEAAPRILQRQRPPHRSLWLTESERSALFLST